MGTFQAQNLRLFSLPCFWMQVLTHSIEKLKDF